MSEMTKAFRISERDIRSLNGMRDLKVNAAKYLLYNRNAANWESYPMSAGRPKKPTAVLAFTGAFKHNPQRAAARINEVQPSGPLGSAPAHFTPELILIWEEYKAKSLPGVLSNADEFQLELLCRLTYYDRELCRTSKGRKVDVKVATAISQALRQLGMTSSSRSDVKADVPAANAKPSNGQPIEHDFGSV